jgi:hypothetical protein
MYGEGVEAGVVLKGLVMVLDIQVSYRIKGKGKKVWKTLK